MDMAVSPESRARARSRRRRGQMMVMAMIAATSGGGSLRVVSITAPVLAQNPIVTNDATPDFDVSLTSPIVGDTIYLEWSTSSLTKGDGSFATQSGISSNTVDASEAAALLVNFTTGTLTDYATWYFHAKHTGPGTVAGTTRASSWSNVVTVVVETAAPTLSSPTDVSTGTTTGTGTVSTNEGQGTLYWVLSSATNTPTAAQVRAGQDHTGGAALKSGSQAVTATGVQTVPFTGLTLNTTYYANYEHSDPTPNHSTVSHADGFTTDNVVDVTPPTITSATTANNAENATLAHSLTANETVTWSIVGGADQSKFEISGSTLRWASNGTKDFEIPDDANANNDYVVTVRATDTALNTTDQTITVTVTDAAEGVGPAVGDGMLLENGSDFLILENADFLLLE